MKPDRMSPKHQQQVKEAANAFMNVLEAYMAGQPKDVCASVQIGALIAVIGLFVAQGAPKEMVIETITDMYATPMPRKGFSN